MTRDETTPNAALTAFKVAAIVFAFIGRAASECLVIDANIDTYKGRI